VGPRASWPSLTKRRLAVGADAVGPRRRKSSAELFKQICDEIDRHACSTARPRR